MKMNNNTSNDRVMEELDTQMRMTSGYTPHRVQQWIDNCKTQDQTDPRNREENIVARYPIGAKRLYVLVECETEFTANGVSVVSVLDTELIDFLVGKEHLYGEGRDNMPRFREMIAPPKL